MTRLHQGPTQHLTTFFSLSLADHAGGKKIFVYTSGLLPLVTHSCRHRCEVIPFGAFYDCPPPLCNLLETHDGIERIKDLAFYRREAMRICQDHQHCRIRWVRLGRGGLRNLEGTGAFEGFI